MSTPQRQKAGASLAAMANCNEWPPSVFSPQRLDAAASLRALSAASSDYLLNSPSDIAKTSFYPQGIKRTKKRRGSVNTYATPTYVLTHEDDLHQQSPQTMTDGSGVKRKFPVPDFFATPGAENGEDALSGRKTKKAKKKRSLVSSGSRSSTKSSIVTKKKFKKVPKELPGSSRKLKALGLLCARFIIMHYNSTPGTTEIKLSELSEHMGIERRRMYDCLNILESIKLVQKVKKDVYVWSGFENTGKILRDIKEHADEHGIFNPQPIANCPNGKSKSLAVLAHQFIAMFVTDACSGTPVTLDEAAECLAKKDATPAEIKTKARRLYDIANICCTLELVEKLRLPGTSYRKPVYRWIGFKRYPWPLKKGQIVEVPCPVEVFEAAGIINEVPKDLLIQYQERKSGKKTSRAKCKPDKKPRTPKSVNRVESVVVDSIESPVGVQSTLMQPDEVKDVHGATKISSPNYKGTFINKVPSGIYTSSSDSSSSSSVSKTITSPTEVAQLECMISNELNQNIVESPSAMSSPPPSRLA